MASPGSGGGIYSFTSGTPIVTDCLFAGNTAGGSGSGGGVALSGVSVSTQLTRCDFINNTASQYGGGLYVNGASPSIVSCTFTGNTAANGGGMSSRSTTSLTASPSLTNCLFSTNTATSTGGALYNGGASGFEITSTIANCTFFDNYAQATGAAGAGGIYNTYASPTVVNSILWGDRYGAGSREMYNTNSSAPSISYSDVEGGCGNIGSAVCGDDNASDNPVFVDSITTDGDGYDLHLQESSPCIDVAFNDAVPSDVADLDDDSDTTEQLPYDLADETRVADGPDGDTTATVDMGAYEY